MKKVLVLVLSVCLLGLVGCHSGQAPGVLRYDPKNTAPQLDVRANGESVDYGVMLHSWNGETDAAIDSAPWFSTGVSEGAKVPSVPLGAEISIAFWKDKPAKTYIREYALYEDGQIAPEWETQDRISAIRAETTWFELQEWRPSYLHGAVNWDTAPPLHGFDMECEWENGNRCTYSFMVREEIQKYDSEENAPPRLRIRAGGREMEPVTQVMRWEGEGLDETTASFGDVQRLLGEEVSGVPKDSVLEFTLDGPAPFAISLSACRLNEENDFFFDGEDEKYAVRMIEDFVLQDGAGSFALRDLQPGSGPEPWGFRLQCIWWEGEQSKACAYLFLLRTE